MVRAVIAWSRSKNLGQPVTSHQPPARSRAVAITSPLTSSAMTPSSSLTVIVMGRASLLALFRPFLAAASMNIRQKTLVSDTRRPWV
jgi:hypothetical protein